MYVGFCTVLNRSILTPMIKWDGCYFLWNIGSISIRRSPYSTHTSISNTDKRSSYYPSPRNLWRQEHKLMNRRLTGMRWELNRNHRTKGHKRRTPEDYYNLLGVVEPQKIRHFAFVLYIAVRLSNNLGLLMWTWSMFLDIWPLWSAHICAYISVQNPKYTVRRK